MSERHSVGIGQIDCTMREVLLPMGLTVDEIRLRGNRTALHTHPFEVQASEPGELDIVITDRSLAAFLNEKQPGGLRDIEIQLSAGRLHVAATKRILIDVRAHAICTLRIEAKRQVFVDLESVDLMGAGAKNLLQTQLDQINPVLDLADFPLNATIENVTIVPGALHIRGTVLP